MVIEAIAQRAIADLVVVLDAVDEARSRQVFRRRAARAAEMRRDLAGVEPALPDRRSQILGAAAIILVIALALARERHPHLVVEIVGPDRVESQGPRTED